MNKHSHPSSFVCVLQASLHDWLKQLAPSSAFSKERLHNAVAIDNFGPFIDTNLAPVRKFSGEKIFRQNDVIFHRPRALFPAGVEFHVLPRVMICFLVEFDLLFAFGVLSCRILDSASLFILYVHEHDRVNRGNSCI